ncbi:AAA family ATPase [Curtobacterium sp. MCBD17_023]|uniref:AAA family ATPase n=1 Tax=Curtobacterium sp. MCBD17_023 TaxID=2175657 RepID=UPI000D83B33B|nr:ATP-binding protein [Curtobacterium sp. MCBD17_023]PYY51855.1 hypothetical protein DEI84_01820 [Curtobacterium sp. MCBD17_023]
MTMAQPVIGREREIAALRTAIRDVDSGGSAFVVDGEAGIGKSSLVADVVEYADSRGVRVLTTTGTLDESAEPYAALHMLLYPLRAGIPNLPAPQRRALDVAFGVEPGVQPSPLLATGSVRPSRRTAPTSSARWPQAPSTATTVPV